jgi:hypothetical protein
VAARVPTPGLRADVGELGHSGHAREDDLRPDRHRHVVSPGSFGRAVGRHFAKYLSGLILYLGYVMVAFTSQKRGLHDYIAGTLVLRR